MKIETKVVWEEYLGNWECKYHKLNPTGRWKIVYDTFCMPPYTLFIEHKGFFFKRFIPENDIKFFDYGESIHSC